MSFTATNWTDLDETRPLGSEDANQADNALRETRSVGKTMFSAEHNPTTGVHKNDIITYAMLKAAAVEAVASALAGTTPNRLGLKVNASDAKKLELLINSTYFDIVNEELTIKTGANLSSFLGSGWTDAAIADMAFGKLTQTAGTGRILVSNAAGGFSLPALTGLTITEAGAVSIQAALNMALYQDKKAQNTNGGTATTGSWEDRDINFEAFDTGSLGAVAGNLVTLVKGSYLALIQAPCHGAVGAHQARLYNNTDSVVTALGSVAEGTDESSVSTIFGFFNITDTKDFKIQHRVGATVSNTGYGKPANWGEEIYTQMLLLNVDAVSA
jgi:hypothetical protein